MKVQNEDLQKFIDVIDEIQFDQAWSNGKGDIPGATYENDYKFKNSEKYCIIPKNGAVKFMDDYGRQAIITHTSKGLICFFQRYSGGARSLWVFNTQLEKTNICLQGKLGHRAIQEDKVLDVINNIEKYLSEPEA